jgi:hypothetical protein
MRASTLLVLLVACSSAEERRAEVIGAATEARFRGDLHTAERILRAAHRVDPEDPELRLELVAVLVADGITGDEPIDLLSGLPATSDVHVLQEKARLWAALGRDDEALRILSHLYRRGYGRAPGVLEAVGSMRSGPRLARLLDEMRTEGEWATAAAWTSALERDRAH